MHRMTTARRTFAVSVAALTLAVTACGDDDGGSDDTTADTVTDETSTTDDTSTEDTATDDTVTATTAPGDTATDDTSDAPTDDTSTGDADIDAYVAEASSGINLGDPATTECLARSLMENIPSEELAATGMSPEEFFAADSLADTGVNVDDELRMAMLEDARNCEGLAAALISQQFGDDPDVEACANDVLDDDLVAEIFVANLTDGERSDEAQAAIDAADACDDDA